MAEYKLISSDSHDYEPPDLWTSRIDPKFRDRAPRVVHLKMATGGIARDAKGKV